MHSIGTPADVEQASGSEDTVSFTVKGSGETLVLDNCAVIVAGYTGRDAHAVQEHIDELAAIGIAPPPQVPMFYPVELASVTSSESVSVVGERTSGEIEPLYIRHGGRYFLGLASDHTDRELEAIDIPRSKAACPKPVGREIIEIPDLSTFSLDDARARSWVDGELYQEGTLSNLRTPSNVIELLIENHGRNDEDFLCLGGTLPVIGGAFKYGTEWKLELALDENTILTHTYRITEGN
ncbi:DUF2848 family protein [Glutamicibacter sp. PS]|uniref:DUF2848 family protein n=1 Tax=Glutamicibacter sp. PS TaxID=3075634 RepID=UPI00283AEB3D|nr:DUF2848 family protein [Glutamicibacter sp. PS]MDR4534953.1 DUF2848 domain-containing protein [Glutamicibacter sp. PS]